MTLLKVGEGPFAPPSLGLLHCFLNC